MIELEKKLEVFRAMIYERALAETGRALQERQKNHEKTLENHRKALLEEREHKLKARAERAHDKANQRVREAMQESREALLHEKQALLEDFMKSLREKLLAYTSTPAYQEELSLALSKARGTCYVLESDRAFLEERGLKNLLPLDPRALGGYVVKSPDGMTAEDHSLLTLLERSSYAIGKTLYEVLTKEVDHAG